MNVCKVYLVGKDGIHWVIHIGTGFAEYDGDTLITDYTSSANDMMSMLRSSTLRSINDHYYMNWIL